MSRKNTTRINTLDKFKVNALKNTREQILTGNMLNIENLNFTSLKEPIMVALITSFFKPSLTQVSNK